MRKLFLAAALTVAAALPATAANRAILINCTDPKTLAEAVVQLNEKPLVSGKAEVFDHDSSILAGNMIITMGPDGAFSVLFLPDQNTACVLAAGVQLKAVTRDE